MQIVVMYALFKFGSEHNILESLAFKFNTNHSRFESQISDVSKRLIDSQTSQTFFFQKSTKSTSKEKQSKQKQSGQSQSAISSVLTIYGNTNHSLLSFEAGKYKLDAHVAYLGCRGKDEKLLQFD